MGFALKAPSSEPSVVVPGPLLGRRVRGRLPMQTLVILIVFAYCVQVVARDAMSYIGMRARYAQIASTQHQLQAEQQRLQNEISYEQSSAYISAAAAQELGMVPAQQVPLAPIQSSAAGNGA